MIRAAMRVLLACAYAVAGVLHLLRPEPFIGIVPDFVPAPDIVVLLTGLAELAGAAALAQPWAPALRRAGGTGLAIYALCVWPANFQHFVLERASPDGGLGLGYHLPRLVAQPVIAWLALWTGGVTDWPFRKAGPPG